MPLVFVVICIVRVLSRPVKACENSRANGGEFYVYV